MIDKQLSQTQLLRFQTKNLSTASWCLEVLESILVSGIISKSEGMIIPSNSEYMFTVGLIFQILKNLMWLWQYQCALKKHICLSSYYILKRRDFDACAMQKI